MQETFIDLDELIVRCKDKLVRKFIQEAVACYRAGAFRSCVVATWNAVVFDFLHKLRQLEQIGNDEASKLLKDFESRSVNADVRKLWEFEKSIPELALKKFEFISPLEKADITRLFEDRSRCAHPSMTSLEELFEATAELARYHLRSAVIHLLQYPPVQGRAARERIFQDIKSEYFPTNTELALKYFQKGPLARARFTLVKDIVTGLTVSLLTDESLEEDEGERLFSALNAISLMYTQETGEILNDKLSNIILDKVADRNWNKVIIYLQRVTAWEKLTEPCQLKAKTFIEKINIYRSSNSKSLVPRNVDVLSNAAYVDFLKDTVIKRLQTADLNTLLEIKKYWQVFLEDIFLMKLIDGILQERFPSIIPDSVNSFVQSKSFEIAKSNADTLARVASLLNSEQWESVLNAFCDNGQIYSSWGCPRVISSLFEDSVKLHGSIHPYWLSFRERLNDEKFSYIDDINSLKQLIDSYPLISRMH